MSLEDLIELAALRASSKFAPDSPEHRALEELAAQIRRLVRERRP